MQPFFSVIVPVHNAEKYVHKCLDSVINQTFKDFEVLIVDDSSSDKTVEVINNIIGNYKNFKLITLSKNSGVANARNIGIKRANGKYICFLDDDDLWLKNKLQIEYEFIRKKKAKWVFSNYEVVDKNYNHLGTRFRVPGKYDYKKMLSHGNPVGLLTVAVESNILKHNYFKKVGHEDYDLWLRLANKGIEGYLLKDVLAQYTKRSNSRSSNKARSIIWTYLCFRRNGCSIINSSKLLLNYALNVIDREVK